MKPVVSPRDLARTRRAHERGASGTGDAPATLAVDEFLAGKPEQLTEVKGDKHVRYYFRKV